MRRLGIATLAILGLNALHASEAQAQPYYQQRLGGPQVGQAGGMSQGIGTYRPAYTPAVQPVSPFLQLANGGNPAVNYYTIVQPQMQMQNALQQLQGQVTITQDAMAAGQGVLPVTTGHGVQFLNSSPYFMRPAMSAPGTGTGAAGGFGTLNAAAGGVGAGTGAFGRPYARPTTIPAGYR